MSETPMSPREALAAAVMGDAVAPPHESKAPTPATTDSVLPVIDAQKEAEQNAIGPRSFKELAEEMRQKRDAAMKAPPPEKEDKPAEEKGEVETEKDAEETPEVEDDGKARHPFNHPTLGKINVSVEQLRKLAEQAVAPQPKPEKEAIVTASEKESAALRQQIAAVEQDDNLSDTEKDVKLARLEAKLARTEVAAQRERELEREKRQEKAERKNALIGEVNDGFAKHKDVFDAEKAFADVPKGIRTSLVSQARALVQAHLMNPANDHVPVPDVISNVAKEMRTFARNLSAEKKAILKEYVGTKRVTSTAGEAPSRAGGEKPRQEGPKAGDLRSGLGMWKLMDALGGRQ